MASKYDEMIKKAIERVVADGYEFLEKGMVRSLSRGIMIAC